jgi:hypothetical protein
MDNKVEVFVTLLIKYDPLLIDHPRDWDWATLIDCSSNDVRVVETFFNVDDDGGIPPTNNPSN